jgi:protein-tyrosine phosphatase
VTAAERARGLVTIGLAVLLAGCATPEWTVPVAPVTVAAKITTAPGSSAAGSASASHTSSTTPGASAPARLRIRSVSNFRDVAGAALALPGGRTMATGVVYRSAKLAGISASDKAVLVDAGLTRILDLRTPGVAKASPDPAIKGAKYRLINLFAVKKTPKPKLRSVAAAKAYMRSLNAGFVTRAAQRKRVAQTLSLIASAPGPVLVHCTEGKDRTGWISAVLQLSAGATTAQVHAEYLKSNEYRAGIIAARYRGTKAHSGRTAAKIERAQLEVEASYLDAGLKALKLRYGSIDGYLTRGLKLDATTVAKLQARLVAG